MPDAKLPLALQLSTLVTRAESGDPVAVCRLAVGASRCRDELRKRKFNDSVMRALESKSTELDGLMINNAAMTEERLAQSGDYCADVDIDSLPSINEVLRQHQVLSPRQKVVVTMTRPDGQLRRLHGGASYSEGAYLIFPQVIADHGYEFLLEGVRAREPLALEALLMIHAPGKAIPSQGMNLALPNPRLFLKYGGLMHELFGEQALEGPASRLLQEAVKTLPAAEIERIGRDVESEASRWRQAHNPSARESLSDWDPRRLSDTDQDSCAP